MQPDFWHELWENNEIAFHEELPHALIVEHFSALNLRENDRVFVPLCGKSVDIAWLLNQRMQVVGIELNELAVQQLFEELKVEPTIAQVGSLKKYTAPQLVIYVGSVFDLTVQELGAVSAIYDRAALVALPEAMREQYVTHLMAITHGAPQLLITFEYDQSLDNGPPFAIHQDLVEQYFSHSYSLAMLSKKPYVPFRKGIEAIECAWLLSKSESF